MARHARGRARLVAMIVALVVIATASSCAGIGGAGAGGGAGGGKAAAKPVITPKQAAAVAKDVQNTRDSAFTSLDGSNLGTVEVDPELTLDQQELQQMKDEGNTLSADAYLSVTPIVPKQTTFPAWFMAVAQTQSGKPALDLYLRSSSSAPWKLTVETELVNGPVRWSRESGDWAVPGDLNADPSATLSDYWNAAVNGGNSSGAGVAAGSMTSEIASQVTSAVTKAHSGGWLQTAGFAARGPLPEAVKLANGDVLSFAWVIEQLKTSDLYGGCFPQPAPNGVKWDPLVANGSYSEVDIIYTYMEGMLTSPDGTLNAVSYATGTTSVTGTQCPS